MSLGFSFNEIMDMEIGFMYDLCITKANMYVNEKNTNDNSGKVHIRNATQADFDRL